MPAPDTTSLAEALRPAVLRLARHLRREAQRVGISEVDWQLLSIIYRRPGIGVSELADMEMIRRPTMSAHVKRLEAAGWIERQPSACGDQRRVGLALTAAGRAALASIRDSRTGWLRDRLAALDPDARDAIAAALPAIAALVEVQP
ncbi:MarR family winged helix-turn-helix transcriptional regulator [Stakelama marina]|uniref:MarR family transcriptional regulator n=1 Tax=Stakelama marina TaxID=2826939 RepID=A0A8T4IG97_9SPHN|nr:MarR family transcriptional regulator [Stakelama marina]MBR0553062.1 MarR family transcriptional regulator [Stakelama marina]